MPQPADVPRNASETGTAALATELPESIQRRNSLVFILNNSIAYFVAPVFYIGVLHAAILHSLGFSDTVANLPETVFLWMLPLPVVIAWVWPSTRHLKRMLIINYLCKGMAGVLAAGAFLWAPAVWAAVAIVAHAGVVGITNGVTNMCLWELIGRGMTTRRRGWTLGVTFGLGPVFAVLGSCLSQLILSGNFLDLVKVPPVPRPWCYVVLFGATAPAMLAAAAGVLLARLPHTATQEPAVSLQNVAAGLRQYFTHPLILLAACGFLLTSGGGNMIMINLALYVREMTGEPPEHYAGLQLALRFGFKSLFGLALGWMLARYWPKVPALATTLISLAGVLWALWVPGKWYMISFGLLGAGELYYIYYLNYIVGCSPPERIRENTAYTNVISVLVSILPVVYGAMSDRFGLRSSFLLATALLVMGATVVILCLPRHPRPQLLPLESTR